MGKSKKNSRVQNDNIMQINKKKCIGCTACAFTCAKETKVAILKEVNNGKKTVDPKQGSFGDSGCIYCGQCAIACPTEAMSIRNDVELVKEALNSGKYLVLISSPSVKATLGEQFNLPIGTYVGGKIAPSAKKLGFQNVFDTEFGADMVTVEESTELIKRIANKERLPMFTSCCSAWIRYAEHFHPEVLQYISTSKSPQQLMGAGIKTYFADTYNILPNNIVTVSVNSCAAKKYEAEREEMGRNNYKDVDIVLTTSEYAEILKEKGIDITAIPNEQTNPFMSEHTGAADIFGISGGAMNSILRTAANYLNSDISEVSRMQFNKVFGYDNIKEANISLGGQKYKVAVINGLREIDGFLNSGKWKDYLYIEVMACRGGCVNGSGAPRIEKKSDINENLCIICGTCIENCPVNAIQYNVNGRAEVQKEKCVGCKLCSNICRANAIKIQLYDKATNSLIEKDYIKSRTDVLSDIDIKSVKRVSDENERIHNMYKNYIGEPDGVKANELLHTSYYDKSTHLQNRLDKKRKKH
ncbi:MULTISPECIES: [Fe-Fe] hydrogenase large subunit C-terminal domain-containing protein [unclassified Clostridium]|uniref:[Fe-Fe] hydrogenase large subunit C-terminal domain-containing protein n=1 Tax=unclassified Clostridium TaxID=2614128 RepID=UPI000297F172|nr:MULTISPECIES: [Fe-Fe] hydrogenase large subunit C-terminal domain-containing protein [unclassified Clostridium]EKQ51715.1 MAG: iron only hydrogenase large subunit [Clostridium sp. Maddingley MBC34-26]